MSSIAESPFAQFVAQLRKLIADFEPDIEGDETGSDAGSSDEAETDLLSYAEALYSIRRDRAENFGNRQLFGEPAWDILLDLYIAQTRGKMVSVSSACIASGVPSTTALRYLAVLEEEGMIERQHDPADARRSWIKLTLRGAKAVRKTLLSATSRLRKPLGHPVL